MDLISKYNLSWRVLKALYTLFEEGKTNAKIGDDHFISHLMSPSKRLLKYRMGNHNIIEMRSGYKDFYEAELAESMEAYNEFLIAHDLEADARRNYTESDIETLMFVKEQAAELRTNLTTQEAFSTEFFDSAKYLKQKDSVRKAVLTLLQVDDFPDESPKNHLWRFVVDAPEPRMIVICENLANLKRGWKAKKKQITLWYVGGNNTKILNDIPSNQLSLPIYYSCDWDYNGLLIFNSVKRILESRGASVEILLPPAHTKRLRVDSPNHKSRWKHGEDFSGLNKKNFNQEERNLIEELIEVDQWIEEEAWDLFPTIAALSIP
ncbi:MAG: hypothetical protein EP332_04585 [Bacteroidetes bacterium]|nr:MAG: hypothetical protein EP332_04585 [Bacteroidota bacterium]